MDTSKISPSPIQQTNTSTAKNVSANASNSVNANTNEKSSKTHYIGMAAAAGVAALAIGGMIYFRAHGKTAPSPKAEVETFSAITDKMKEQAKEILAGFKKYEQELVEKFNGVKKEADIAVQNCEKVKWEAYDIKGKGENALYSNWGRVTDTCKEVLDTVNGASKNNYQDIINGVNLTKFQTEADTKGTVLKVTLQEFQDGILKRNATVENLGSSPKISVEQYYQDGFFEKFAQDGNIHFEYGKGKKDEGKKIYEIICSKRCDNNTIKCKINTQELPTGRQIVEKEFITTDGRDYFNLNEILDERGNTIVPPSDKYVFQNGRVKEIISGYNDKKGTIERRYAWEDNGELSYCFKNESNINCNTYFANSTTPETCSHNYACDEYYSFASNGPLEYRSNIKNLPKETGFSETREIPDSLFDKRVIFDSGETGKRNISLIFENKEVRACKDSLVSVVNDTTKISDGSKFANVDKDSFWQFENGQLKEVRTGENKYR